MPINTFAADEVIDADRFNENFALCVLTDTARTITVTHTWTASQTFTGGWTAAAACTITSASATAFTVGRQGATNPVLAVVANAANVVTGVSLTGAAADGGFAIAVTSSGSNENLTLDAKGTGTITIGGTSSGGVTLGGAVSVTGTSHTLNSAGTYKLRRFTISTTVTSSGTYDFDIRGDTAKGFRGLITVYKAKTGSPTINRNNVWAVSGRGTSMTFDEINGHTGAGGDSGYSLSNSGTGGIVRLTETGAAGGCDLVIVYDGTDAP